MVVKCWEAPPRVALRPHMGQWRARGRSACVVHGAAPTCLPQQYFAAQWLQKKDFPEAATRIIASVCWAPTEEKYKAVFRNYFIQFILKAPYVIGASFTLTSQMRKPRLSAIKQLFQVHKTCRCRAYTQIHSAPFLLTLRTGIVNHCLEFSGLKQRSHFSQ
jgi:hypothetical protein